MIKKRASFELSYSFENTRCKEYAYFVDSKNQHQVVKIKEQKLSPSPSQICVLVRLTRHTGWG